MWQYDAEDTTKISRTIGLINKNWYFTANERFTKRKRKL